MVKVVIFIKTIKRVRVTLEIFSASLSEIPKLTYYFIHSLSPVLFSLFMNDLPQYCKQNNCPGVVLENQSLNCLMYADDLLVISPSPEGLQQSLDVIHKHAQDWKLKVNAKKSNIIILSGNGQNKNRYR